MKPKKQHNLKNLLKNIFFIQSNHNQVHIPVAIPEDEKKELDEYLNYYQQATRWK